MKTTNTKKQRTVNAGNVQIWTFDNLAVRSVQSENEQWFVCNDVATALKCSNLNEITKNLDAEEIANCAINTTDGIRQVTVISESGLYHTIFAGRNEPAKSFRRWIIFDVLPVLRKNSAYGIKVNEEIKTAEKNLELARIKANRYVYKQAIKAEISALPVIENNPIQAIFNCKK